MTRSAVPYLRSDSYFQIQSANLNLPLLGFSLREPMGLPALPLLLTLASLQHVRFGNINCTILHETFDENKANEAVNKRGRGRRPKQLSVEEEEIRKKKKNERDRDDRAKKKCEFIRLQKQQELFMEFCEKLGITEIFKDFYEKKAEEHGKLFEALGEASEALWDNEANQDSNEEIEMILKDFSENLEMIQTVELEGVTAVDSSSLGGGLMADARQNYGHTLATQGPLLSTNKGTQIQMREATHDGEASTSSQALPSHHELGLGSKREVSMYDILEQYVKLKDTKRRQQDAATASIDANCKFKEKKKEADNLNKQVKGLEEGFSKLKAELAEKGRISKDALKLQMSNAVTLGWNLMKKLLQSMQPGSEFLNLCLLDTIQHHPSLQNQFNEGLTLIGQGHPIDDKVAIQSDNPPVVVPRSFFACYNMWEIVAAQEPDISAILGDAANIAVNGPQFQAANTRANNVEQEDPMQTIRRMDEATEVDVGMDMATLSGW